MERHESGLNGDSRDYWMIEEAVESVIKHDVPGLFVEIGLREGGGSRHVIDAIHRVGARDRTLVAIDPYGGIMYRDTDTVSRQRDYTNTMRDSCLPRLIPYAEARGVNLIYQCMEDTEFFRRFADGVPVYLNGQKEVVKHIAFTHVDGPHSTGAVTQSFYYSDRRARGGAAIVFDDIGNYDHTYVHLCAIEAGWQPLSLSERKASYIKGGGN